MPQEILNFKNFYKGKVLKIKKTNADIRINYKKYYFYFYFNFLLLVYFFFNKMLVYSGVDLNKTILKKNFFGNICCIFNWQ